MDDIIKFRWVVSYIHKDCMNDLDLMRSMNKEYFTNELKATQFAEKQRHKTKPDYWQPDMWKEEEYEVTNKYWRCKK